MVAGKLDAVTAWAPLTPVQTAFMVAVVVDAARVAIPFTAAAAAVAIAHRELEQGDRALLAAAAARAVAERTATEATARNPTAAAERREVEHRAMAVKAVAS